MADITDTIKQLSQPYLSAVNQASKTYGIPVSTLLAQEYVESGFQPGAISSAGAVGIAQFIPSTGAAYGLNYADLFNPFKEIDAEAHYLKDLGYQQNPTLALEEYNAGSVHPELGAGYASNVLSIQSQLMDVFPSSGQPPPTNNPVANVPVLGGVVDGITGLGGAVQNSGSAIGSTASTVGTDINNATKDVKNALTNPLSIFGIPNDIGIRAAGVIIGIVFILGGLFIIAKS